MEEFYAEREELLRELWDRDFDDMGDLYESDLYDIEDSDNEDYE